jgi:serine/threonine-protein kinase
MLAVGTFLGPYEILSMLGSGGMGEVYRARDTRLDRTVAVKIIRDGAASAAVMQRFEREAKALAALTHPNILTIFDFGREGEVAFSVSELLEGETLRTRMSGTTFSWQRVAEIGAAIADGLADAHAASITHRDLKPENIFLVLDGRLKILDFGLARWSGDCVEQAGSAATEVLLTGEGTVLGTLGYMSPEQLRGEAAGPHSDLFSLGCLLYEMVAGKRTFTGATAGDVCAATLRDEPPALTELRPGIPREFCAIVRRCLEKRKEERFRSASDLSFALRAIRAGARDDSSEFRLPEREVIDSIAILPFVNVSGDPDIEYLSDGVAETILDSLSGLKNLRVMSRAAVSRFRGVDLDVLAIGRELGVRALLAGRLQQRGRQVSVAVELVNIVDGSRLWGANYRRQIDDLFVIEEEIAQEISTNLRLKISGEERDALSRRSTGSSEAYQHYLRGRYFCERRTAEAMHLAIDEFTKAIERDPKYALAYAGLADSYIQLGYYCELPPAEAFPNAKSAASRALELDPLLAGARASLAAVMFYYEWDWKGAERAFQSLLVANPDDASAHHAYAILLAGSGRNSEGLAHARSAENIDPLNLAHKTVVAALLNWGGQRADALEHVDRVVEMDPSFPPAHHVRGHILTASGRHEEAIAEYLEASRLTRGGTWFRLSMAHTLAAAGRIDECDRLIQELADSSCHLSHFEIACANAAAHRIDAAFESLEQAFVTRDWGVVLLSTDHRIASLKSDARFAAMERRLHGSGFVG